MERYYSIKQVAEQLGVSKSLVYTLIRREELGVYRVGAKLYRVPESALKAWEKAQGQDQSGNSPSC